MLNRREFLGGAFAGAALSATAAKPNILLVLMDDLGYPSLGCFGNQIVPTPNLDRLAAQGIRFTDAYATPQCTPTRATLLTGQYTSVNKMWHVIPPYHYPNARMAEPVHRANLDRSAFNLAKGMQAAGYATACIGKWHLTNSEDGDYSGLNASGAKYYGFDTVATPRVKRDEYSTGDKGVDRFTDEAIAFVRKNSGRPWFCYLAHHSIHQIVAAPDAIVRKYLDKGFPAKGLNNATYLACIQHFDAAVGRLVKAIDDQKLGENTLVIFMSDNGGQYRIWDFKVPPVSAGQPVKLNEAMPAFSNAPLRMGKGSSYEGGIRVPMIARWSGTIRPGQTCHTPVHIVDFLPTFFEVAGARKPEGYRTDGVSVAPLLHGKQMAPRTLYWYQPFYDIRWLATPSAMIREGDYKLIEFFGDYISEKDSVYRTDGKVELYNLREDIGETNDLASTMPDRVAAMRRKLHAWIDSSGSAIPKLNPAYNESEPLVEAKGQPPVR